MSNPIHPSESFERMPVEHLGGPEHAFVRNEAAINEASRYVDEVASRWVLEPSAIAVEQPGNQSELLENLDTMLRSQSEGEILSAQLADNLAKMRGLSSGEGFYFRHDPDSPAGSILDIKPSFDMGTIDTSGLSHEEYHRLRRESYATEENMEDPAQPNVMLTGLLEATGARVLRDDIADGNGRGSRIYKGMLEGNPVYLVESINPRVIEEDGQRKTVFERRVWAENEVSVRGGLNRLSETDEDVLKSIGVDIPMIGSHQYNTDTYPNRSRMLETLRLFRSMGSSQATGEKSQDNYESAPASKEVKHASVESKELAHDEVAELGAEQRPLIDRETMRQEFGIDGQLLGVINLGGEKANVNVGIIDIRGTDKRNEFTRLNGLHNPHLEETDPDWGYEGEYIIMVAKDGRFVGRGAGIRYGETLHLNRGHNPGGNEFSTLEALMQQAGLKVPDTVSRKHSDITLTRDGRVIIRNFKPTNRTKVNIAKKELHAQ